ncbi:MAG: hypothetical protein AAFP89_10595 [Bacteroidota bacterium]
MMKRILLLMLALAWIGCAIGQSKIDTITLKKGEVLDILLLSQYPDKKAALRSYFQTASPVAKRMSYQPQPGFRIVDHSQGNHRPDLLILGKWRDIEVREAFLTQIVEEVADFHERRRDIWSYFGLQYFEMHEDVSMEIHRDHYQVATAFWLESDNQPSKFYEKWGNKVQALGGDVLIELKEGKSPAGYQYNPQFFVITSWKSEAAFRDFQEKVQRLKRDNIQHVNELILQ